MTILQDIHPYPSFIPEGASALIIGTIPQPRFALKRLFEEDVDFYYGSKDNLFWKTIEQVYGVRFTYYNTLQAIQERMDFLTSKGIGMTDMVEICKRTKPVTALESATEELEYRDVLALLEEHPSIRTIYFTSGAGGAESYFSQVLAQKKIFNAVLNYSAPRHKRFELKDGRAIETYTLYSPSPVAARSGITMERRVEQYKQYLPL